MKMNHVTTSCARQNWLIAGCCGFLCAVIPSISYSESLAVNWSLKTEVKLNKNHYQHLELIDVDDFVGGLGVEWNINRVGFSLMLGSKLFGFDRILRNPNSCYNLINDNYYFGEFGVKYEIGKTWYLNIGVCSNIGFGLYKWADVLFYYDKNNTISEAWTSYEQVVYQNYYIINENSFYADYYYNDRQRRMDRPYDILLEYDFMI
jgi:hypothetical protein